MKTKFLCLSICLFAAVSCVGNLVDSSAESEKDANKKHPKSIVKRSAALAPADSISIISRLQSDVDHLMMGRVVQRDSVFVLAIKKQDAAFLGVSEEVYDRYQRYVDELNEKK